MATGDVIELGVVEVCGDPGVFVVVRVSGADAQSFLVADRVPVVEPDALRPVETDAGGVVVGGRRVALRHGPVHGVLQPPTSVREPVRYLDGTAAATHQTLIALNHVCAHTPVYM